MNTKLITLAVAVLMAASTLSWGQIPKTISYQGVLTDGAGTAVPDGNYNMVFRLYDVSSGGTAIWTETQNGVPVSGGLFNVTLGSAAALDVAFDKTYWMTTSVDGGPETSPRRELTASPYSINAYAVQGSTNVFLADGNVGIGTTTPGSPLAIHFDNLNSSLGSIALDNNLPGGQDVINFMNVGVADARIRYADGGGLHVGTIKALDLVFSTFNTVRMTVGPTGNVLIGGAGSAVEKLDVDGAVRLGTTTNTNAGTIRFTGTDFEGYDGSTWKSFTAAGGGGLPAGAAGQTLRHDGVDWVADGLLYNDGAGIGIDVASPEAKLHISGGQVDLGGTEGDFKIGDSNHRLEFGVGLIGGETGTARIRAEGVVASKLVLGAGTADIVTVNPDGSVDVGSTAQDGSLRVFRNGVAGNVINIGHTAEGGQIATFDESGSRTVAMIPDGDGQGGYFTVYRPGGLPGFYVDGNDTGVGEPEMSIVGSSLSASFRMGLTGNGSVALPADAVGSAEILDEPGVASDTRPNQVSLSGGVEAVRFRTITAPSAGYVMVIASFQVGANHTNGVFTSANFGVSDSATTFPANQDVGFQVPSTAPSGNYVSPVTVHGLFEVTAGAHTFYLLAELFNGAISTDDIQITEMFFPTAYGTVTPMMTAGAAENRALTSSDIAAEQAQAAQVHRERVDRELAAMRAELEALKSEMARD